MLKTLLRRLQAQPKDHDLPLGGVQSIAAIEPPGALKYSIDRYSVFQGTLSISGWCHLPEAKLETIDLVMPNGEHVPIPTIGLPSPDVGSILGAQAENARFDATIPVAASATAVADATLRLSFQSWPPIVLTHLGKPVGDPAHALFGRFHNMLHERELGRLLEVGSRARSGIVRRHIAPEGWEYSGLDVMAGPNVDVVGDAHELSSLYPPKHFDAVMAFSVLEHLLMPWKFAVELNRVLKPGGFGLFTTHQCWPLHDEPWDFWRFSNKAWASLLNPATGFKIIDAQMGEPAYVVAARCHPATAFAETPAGALASFVLFQKISETKLEWPVSLQAITDSYYPTATTDVSGA